MKKKEKFKSLKTSSRNRNLLNNLAMREVSGLPKFDANINARDYVGWEPTGTKGTSSADESLRTQWWNPFDQGYTIEDGLYHCSTGVFELYD